MRLKKGDLLIIILMIIASLGWLIKDHMLPETSDKHAVIKIDTKVYKTIPLGKGDERIEIPLNLQGDDYVHIVIEKGNVWVEDASCPDKVCVKTGPISKSGQSIVCLPNKTVVYIEGAEEMNIDDVTF